MSTAVSLCQQAPTSDSGTDAESAGNEAEMLLQRGDLMALGNRLKEALETYAAALRLGPVRSGRLGTLVEALLLSYRAREGIAPVRIRGGRQGPELYCPGCGGFLGEPVTTSCGHTYCRLCLRRELLCRCRFCPQSLVRRAEEDGQKTENRTSVILNQLTEKWFPQQSHRAKELNRLSEFLRKGHFEAAQRIILEAMKSDPEDLMLRVYRAELYAGRQEFMAAVHDLNVVLSRLPDWPEGYFRKAKVLQDTGFVDDSLQLFLQCLALDEDFAPAKLAVEKILCDLLSPVPENVKEGLKEPAWISLHHTQSKPFVLGTGVEQPCSLQPNSDQNSELPKGGKHVVKRCLDKTEHICELNLVEKLAKKEGLKRVSSEPLLSGPEKGALLKRKLTVSDQDLTMCDDGTKHTKQGGTIEGDAVLALLSQTVPKDLIDVSDFECSLCMRLLFEPVTIPCGHTFCKKCLERCLDHAPQCPLCKESLTEYLASRKYNVTQLLEELIRKYLPDELSERRKIYEEEIAELSNLTKNVPVFICTMAYPTVPCPLHVFEPRYRLMIRRSIESGTKQFGMCISDPQKNFADYGCMLQIRNIHFLHDGRSIIDTVGGKRFRVVQRLMKDGYYTADIEYLEDIKVEDEEKLYKLQELHDVVYSQACTWFQNLRNRFRSQILHHFGSMPEKENIQVTPDGPAWCWWLLAVLPVDRRYQLSVLSMMSLQERLIKLQQILTYFSRNQSK
ncbi:LON peptidase N-terminal domain and RING finger protein 1 [Microcaecilia unicolor]|uniref:LON peptidase N-terminal domain and RING finger protein 1 n=1 Tax=Microcaecilia unicolor TaxID=1415580 RepID=A0A6P7X9N4_9AMPH|nr:LON peptidase N-terminal domain and RING finger protein 1 [Microcaecilia unicolor]